MALRDLQHRDQRIVFVVGGLNAPAMQAIPAALIALSADPSFRAARRRRPRSGVRPYVAVGRARGAAEASVVRSGDATTTALIETALQLQFRGLPLFVVLSGSKIAVCLDHEVFDGTAAMEVVEYLLASAAGQVRESRRQVALFPLLTALTTVSPRALASIATARVRKRLGAAASTSASNAGPVRADSSHPPALAEMRIDEALAASARRIPSGGGNRATLNSRLCSLILTTLQDVAIARHDRAVRMPVDLRSAVRDRRVEGNFVYSPKIGTLFGSTWLPAEITARLASSSVTEGLVSLAGGTAVVLARRIRHTPVHWEPRITVSLVRAQDDLPMAAFSDPSDIELVCMNSRAGVPTVFVFVWLLQSTAHITVWDETGSFDLSRFESAFRAEIERRSSAR